MDLVKVEDSYADRRQLFKDIWDTASNLDDKDADIPNKPRVIKTLRLDEEDRSVVNKKNKKLKAKNLQTVCNKLLDFCDMREANHAISEKVKMYRVIKKVKKYKIKKKANNISHIPSTPNENPTQVKVTSETIETVAISSERREAQSVSSEKEGNSGDAITEPSRDCSPPARSPVHTISKPSRGQRNSSALLKHSAYRKTKRSTK